VSLLFSRLDGLLRRSAFDGQRVDPPRAFAALLELLRNGLYETRAAGAESRR
jgi:hypothetical protein